MQPENFSEMRYLRSLDVLLEDPTLYHQIIYGFWGVMAAMAGFIVFLIL